MIDWDRVESLREEIGKEDFAEVVEMFLAESDQTVARLLAGRPDPTLEADLHFLKGSALNLGFSALAARCSAGEKRAAAGAPVDVAEVAECFAATRSAFTAALPGVGLARTG
jgi:HPt (histidine-containing phosphotransfer) domain-containing protein